MPSTVIVVHATGRGAVGTALSRAATCEATSHRSLRFATSRGPSTAHGAGGHPAWMLTFNMLRMHEPRRASERGGGGGGLILISYGRALGTGAGCPIHLHSTSRFRYGDAACVAFLGLGSALT